MTCRELADFLDGYAAGDLPAGVRSAFEHHLAVCVNCVRYLEQYKLSIELGRRAFDASDGDVPTDVPEDLVRAISAALRSPQRQRGFRLPPSRAALRRESP
jgi:anti-sigma factor RsiW